MNKSIDFQRENPGSPDGALDCEAAWLTERAGGFSLDLHGLGFKGD
jgi:hypothetical protein